LKRLKPRGRGGCIPRTENGGLDGKSETEAGAV